eukprot:TRINITY_DN409_c1_g1_i1.p1 TRINITY_DN409_c1_g1~~TRINITY_DN409_c1_g1_i1.p1  ORF type:complete len:231 (-),score=26.99 TRINITY_DN409_c1_g1_i1:108-800(-)
MTSLRSRCFGDGCRSSLSVTLLVVLVLLSLSTLTSCRSYYSSRSRYYYYSYYSYYYSSCAPPSPPVYCASQTDPHFNTNITSRCAGITLTTGVDTNTPLNDYASTITGWIVDYEKLYFYDNATFNANFFSSCHTKIVTALCQSYVQSCSEGSSLKSCVSACKDMKKCREDIYKASVSNDTSTDFWYEDCLPYSVCDAAGNNFCCWNDATTLLTNWSYVIFIVTLCSLLLH